MNQAAGHSVPSGILFFLWNLNAPLRRSGGHKAEDAPDKENHMNMNVYLNWSCCSAFEPCCRFLASWNFYFRPGWRLDGFSPSSLVCSLCMDSAHRWDASSSSLNSPVFSPLPLQMCLSWKWIWFPNSPPKMRRLTSGRLFPSNTRTGLERSFCRVSFGSFVDSLFQLTGLCFLFCFVFLRPSEKSEASSVFIWYVFYTLCHQRKVHEPPGRCVKHCSDTLMSSSTGTAPVRQFHQKLVP